MITFFSANKRGYDSSVFCMLILCIAVVFLFPVDALATEDDSQIVAVLCNLIDVVTGTMGKAIATFVIITMAAGAFNGKMTWSNVLLVSIGMSALFGAKTVVAKLTGSDEVICVGFA